MKLSNSYTLLLVIFVAWASLFTTVLFQSHRTNQLLRNDSVLLAQQKQTLETISTNAKIRTQQINNLQSHIDCLFNLATRPNHSSAYIVNANQCLITSSQPSNSLRSSGTASPTPASTSPQSAPSNTTGSGPPSPQPPKSTVCKLIKRLC